VRSIPTSRDSSVGLTIRDMNRGQKSIAFVGAVIALSFILFPEWHAVHPTNPALSVSLGMAWVGAPPEPPLGFDQVNVVQSSLGAIGAVIVLLVTGVLMLLARGDE
jgi:hypothetical protein